MYDFVHSHYAEALVNGIMITAKRAKQINEDLAQRLRLIRSDRDKKEIESMRLQNPIYDALDCAGNEAAEDQVGILTAY
jgi:hypothetical protein